MKFNMMKVAFAGLLLAVASSAFATNPPNPCGNHGNNCNPDPTTPSTSTQTQQQNQNTANNNTANAGANSSAAANATGVGLGIGYGEGGAGGNAQANGGTAVAGGGTALSGSLSGVSGSGNSNIGDVGSTSRATGGSVGNVGSASLSGASNGDQTTSVANGSNSLSGANASNGDQSLSGTQLNDQSLNNSNAAENNGSGNSDTQVLVDASQGGDVYEAQSLALPTIMTAAPALVAGPGLTVERTACMPIMKIVRNEVTTVIKKQTVYLGTDDTLVLGDGEPYETIAGRFYGRQYLITISVNGMAISKSIGLNGGVTGSGYGGIGASSGQSVQRTFNRIQEFRCELPVAAREVLVERKSVGR